MDAPVTRNVENLRWSLIQNVREEIERLREYRSRLLSIKKRIAF